MKGDVNKSIEAKRKEGKRRACRESIEKFIRALYIYNGVGVVFSHVVRIRQRNSLLVVRGEGLELLDNFTQVNPRIDSCIEIEIFTRDSFRQRPSAESEWTKRDEQYGGEKYSADSLITARHVTSFASLSLSLSLSALLIRLYLKSEALFRGMPGVFFLNH